VTVRRQDGALEDLDREEFETAESWKALAALDGGQLLEAVQPPPEGPTAEPAEEPARAGAGGGQLEEAARPVGAVRVAAVAAPMARRAMLELFSGQGTVASHFREKGWLVFTLDKFAVDPFERDRANARARRLSGKHFQRDIEMCDAKWLDSFVKKLDDKYNCRIEFVWASPECKLYSAARTVEHGETLHYCDRWASPLCVLSKYQLDGFKCLFV
jgi:hypothetical protein